MTAIDPIGGRLGKAIEGTPVVGSWARAVTPWDDRNIGRIVQVTLAETAMVETKNGSYWAVGNQLMYWAPLPLPYELPAGIEARVGNNGYIARGNLVRIGDGRWRGPLAIGGLASTVSGVVEATNIDWGTYWRLIAALGLEERIGQVAREGLVEIDEALEELAKLSEMLK